MSRCAECMHGTPKEHHFLQTPNPATEYPSGLLPLPVPDLSVKIFTIINSAGKVFLNILGRL